MKALASRAPHTEVVPATARRGESQNDQTDSDSYLPAHYSGPADGASHPRHARLMDNVTRGVVPLLYRVRVHDGDKMPLEGPQVYCFNHPSTVDPEIMRNIVPRDVRYMASMDLFQGVMGPVMTWAGAFPVNRQHPSPTTIHHATDVLQQGLGLGIAPEGACSSDPLKVDAFKRGPAYIGMKGGAENLVPITFYYHENDEVRVYPKERAAGLIAAAALTGLAVATAIVTPALAPVLAVGCAALAGGALVGRLARHAVKMKQFSTQALGSLGVKADGGLVGALVVGAATAVALAAAPVAAPFIVAGAALAGGAAVLGLSRGWQHRNLADGVVGDPIPVQPYVEDYGIRQGSVKLSEDLHRSMGSTKAELTGVPYDDMAPKMKPANDISTER